MNGLLIIPILAFLILIHEIGHFVSARMVGVKVEEFGIGIPPRIKGWTRNGVIWSVNAIPFGGFVRVKGEDGADMEPGSMNTKSPYQRAFFLGAGSFMNVVTAIVLMIFLIGVQGVPEEQVYFTEVVPGSPAETAGWQTGDVVLSVEGEAIEDTSQIIRVTRDFAGSPMAVTLQRGGETVQTSVTPREDPPRGQGPTGVGLTTQTISDVFVGEIVPGSAAASAGLQTDDRIVSIDGIEVRDGFLVRTALADAQGRAATMLVDGEGETRTVQVQVPVAGLTIEDVLAGTPGGLARWQPGDRLVTIGGQPITGLDALAEALRGQQGATLPVEVIRSGETIGTTLVVPAIAADVNPLTSVGIDVSVPALPGLVGFDDRLVSRFDEVPLSQVLPLGFEQAWQTTQVMVAGIRDLFTGQASLDQIAGPVGMGQITSEALEQSSQPDWYVLGTIMILLSLNLAVLNLLPLPALDGGRLLFVLVEILRGGRRIAPEKEGLVHFVGLVTLLIVMFVVAFGDVDRILDGDRFFQ